MRRRVWERMFHRMFEYHDLMFKWHYAIGREEDDSLREIMWGYYHRALDIFEVCVTYISHRLEQGTNLKDFERYIPIAFEDMRVKTMYPDEVVESYRKWRKDRYAH